MSVILDNLDAKSGSIYIIVNLYRLGALSFVTELEHLHYPPDTDRNDDFNVFYLTYRDLPHCIVEVPAKDICLIESEAARHKLTLVNGKPLSPTYSEFRLKCSGEQCYTIETAQHQSMTAREHRKAIDQERRDVAAFVQKLEHPGVVPN